MRRNALFMLLACAFLTPVGVAMAQQQATASSPRNDAGVLPVRPDAADGKVLLGIRSFNQPFLLVTSTPGALGSNDVGLDRNAYGRDALVEFRRAGKRVLLVQLNTRFRADSNNPDERALVRDAFAESVLWGGDIASEDAGVAWVDVRKLLLTDLHGIAQRLNATKQGSYSIDAERSAVISEAAKSFADNTELEALLTFAGPGQGGFVRDVATDAQSLSLRQHLSLLKLPGPGFQPRRYHPASGGFSSSWFDFAQSLTSSLEVAVQPRFRLEKTDPAAAVSTVKQPIVFYLDRGTPEPVRSALLDGANWWKTAFEKAGFRDAYRVELLPEGVDPLDARFNTITWAHRATRGWSYGNAITDPRTGEIMRGAVTLGSQRVRQDILIAEALLAPYGGNNDAATRDEAVQMALARLRQLAAHEVGHALGLAHNFAASRNGFASVMDYPHPLVRIDNGKLRLDKAYGVGVGAWDDFAIAHAYRQFPPGQEEAGLAALRADAARQGLRYISDGDARGPGDSDPDGLLWDSGQDSIATYDELMQIRRIALANFGRGVLPPDRQAGEFEARLVPVYLLHRYQIEAVARQLAGEAYDYEEGSGMRLGTRMVSPQRQREALKRMVASLQAPALALPDNVIAVLTPQANGYDRTREYFQGKVGPVFDPLAAAEATAAQTVQFLLAPERLNRLHWQHARSAAAPGVREALDAAFNGSWMTPAATGSSTVLQQAAAWVYLDAVMRTLEDGGLHPQVDAQLRASLRDWQSRLAKAGSADARAASDRIGTFCVIRRR